MGKHKHHHHHHQRGPPPGFPGIGQPGQQQQLGDRPVIVTRIPYPVPVPIYPQGPPSPAPMGNVVDVRELRPGEPLPPGPVLSVRDYVMPPGSPATILPTREPSGPSLKKLRLREIAPDGGRYADAFDEIPYGPGPLGPNIRRQLEVDRYPMATSEKRWREEPFRETAYFLGDVEPYRIADFVRHVRGDNPPPLARDLPPPPPRGMSPTRRPLDGDGRLLDGMRPTRGSPGPRPVSPYRDPYRGGPHRQKRVDEWDYSYTYDYEDSYTYSLTIEKGTQVPKIRASGKQEQGGIASVYSMSSGEVLSLKQRVVGRL